MVDFVFEIWCSSLHLGNDSLHIFLEIHGVRCSESGTHKNLHFTLLSPKLAHVYLQNMHHGMNIMGLSILWQHFSVHD
jgi:hypothetical protein